MRGPASAALAEGWPLFITAAITGVAFGVVARQAGLDAVQTSGMSVIVFAGASQFAAVELLASGSGVLAVALTVLLVNLRHVLMAVALRPSLDDLPAGRRAALAYLLTDESFAMAIGWFRRGRREIRYYVVFGAALWLAWNLATMAGAFAGALIGDPRRLGVDFAITATFTAIVALGVRSRTDAVVALVAALAAGVLRLAGASVVAVVVAGALAPLLALALPPRGAR